MSRRERLEEMLAVDPADVFLNYALAKELVSQGETAAGLERFDRVLELDPDYVAAWFQKAQLFAEAGRIEDARTTAREGVEVARRVGDEHALGEMSEFLETLG